MTRSAAVWITLLVAVVVMGAVAPTCSCAGVFIEPEFGGRWISSNWDDFGFGSGPYSVKGNILGPGITIGGTIGVTIIPMVAIVAHADYGFHGAASDVTVRYHDEVEMIDVVGTGSSLDLLLGGRVYPMAEETKQPLQPYVGVGFGLGAIAWTYSDDVTSGMGSDADGVGAFLIALEAGADMKMSDAISVGAGGRYVFHQWAEKSVEELDTTRLTGNSLNVQLHVGFHF
jgi:hypothetical protein